MTKIVQKIGILFFSLLFIFPSAGACAAEESLEFLRTQNILEAGEEQEYPKRFVFRKDWVRWTMRSTDFMGDETGQEPFHDVENNPYVAKAWEIGAIKTQPYFSPDRPILLYEALKVLSIAHDLDTSEKSAFTWQDLPEDTELRDIMLSAVKRKLIQPVSDTHLGTYNKLTRRQAAEILYTLVFSSSQQQKQTITIRTKILDSNKQKILETIWEELQKKSLYAEDLDEQILLEGAIEGLLEALEDPHAHYWTQEETEERDQISQGGNISGIGAQIQTNVHTGEVFIVSTFPGTPAENAGILPGDIIVGVDGQDVSEKEAEIIANLIRGEEGTDVVIQIRRNNIKKTFTLSRATIQIPLVEISRDNDIVNIEYRRFERNALKQVRAFVTDAEQMKDVKGIILDLRNNPGGDLGVTLEMMGFFLPQDEDGRNATGTWLEERDSITRERVVGDPILQDMPFVVLVNRYSASGSEMLAAGMKDHKRALVIGEQTYGKGTAQRRQYFYDGSSWRYTIANWLSPDKHVIEGVGVIPHIEIATLGGDDQALEIAMNKIKRGQTYPAE